MIRSTIGVVIVTVVLGVGAPASVTEAAASLRPAAAQQRAARPAAGQPAAPQPAGLQPGAAEVGAAGIGDPYFPVDGNGGYDVRHYDVHDSYRMRVQRISGWTRIRARATRNLSRFHLDFLLRVLSVSVNGRPATFTRPSRHEVRITPAVPVARGALFRVRVRYAGRPARVGWQGERNWLANRREAVAMNEPHMAPWWFPSSDHPRDKATMDVHITVPRGRRVIANGVLRGLSRGPGTVTWHWHAAEPMATYLAFFAAGRFTVERGVRGGLPWLIAVSNQLTPAHRDQSLRLLRRTPAVVAWLASQLGDYPFSTTGGLTTSLSPGFALENQTRPTYPWVGGPENVGLLVHELGHQWFGDDVSVQAWRDIWLNEGFATFLEARYEETHGGETAQDWLTDWYAGTPAGDSFWNQRIGEPGPRRLFAFPVYIRGGMTVQALRNRVGEDDFWAVLRAWIERRGGGNGSSEDFWAVAEEVSGEDLDGFFEAWLFTGRKPARTADNGLA